MQKMHMHTHTHALYRLIGVKDNVKYSEKRNVLSWLLNCMCEKTAVSDVSREVVPDNGSLHRE